MDLPMYSQSGAPMDGAFSQTGDISTFSLLDDGVELPKSKDLEDLGDPGFSEGSDSVGFEEEDSEIVSSGPVPDLEQSILSDLGVSVEAPEIPKGEKSSSVKAEFKKKRDAQLDANAPKPQRLLRLDTLDKKTDVSVQVSSKPKTKVIPNVPLLEDQSENQTTQMQSDLDFLSEVTNSNEEVASEELLTIWGSVPDYQEGESEIDPKVIENISNSMDNFSVKLSNPDRFTWCVLDTSGEAVPDISVFSGNSAIMFSNLVGEYGKTISSLFEKTDYRIDSDSVFLEKITYVLIQMGFAKGILFSPELSVVIDGDRLTAFFTSVAERLVIVFKDKQSVIRYTFLISQSFIQKPLMV